MEADIRSFLPSDDPKVVLCTRLYLSKDNTGLYQTEPVRAAYGLVPVGFISLVCCPLSSRCFRAQTMSEKRKIDEEMDVSCGGCDRM